MKAFIATSAFAATALFLGVTWYVSRGSDDQFAPCQTNAVASKSALGGPFELVNAQGKTVTDKEIITEPSMLYFGYTFCPDVCPLDAARNADAVDILAEKGYSMTPVFITIDPKRDTPGVVGDFAYNMHEKMIGLTGSAEQIKAASKAYRTYYKVQPSDDEYYLVDHSTFSYLVLPEHGFVKYFRRDTSAEEMAKQVACFIDNA